MRNAKPLEQVRCYTQGCKDTSLYCGPACDSCWHQLSKEERNIIKKEFIKDCEKGVYVPSINKLCSIYGCYRPVQLKGGAAADGRCSTCRGEGKMSTVVDTGVEKEEAAPPSLSSLSQSPPRSPRLALALAVPAPDIVDCPRLRSPRSRSPRARSSRLATLVHKLYGGLERQRQDLDRSKENFNELCRYTNVRK